MGWVFEGDGDADAGLLAVLAELREREPIFHRRAVVADDADFERETADDFWETGASGRRYDRGDVLATLRGRWAASAVDEADSEGWVTTDVRLREIGPLHYLLAYTLHGQGRVTQRLTVWHRADHGWEVVYHQGTVVAPD